MNLENIKRANSFSGKGNTYDNACIESFHSVLNKEEVTLVKYLDFDAARLAIFEYIESWYNRERRHSSLGYITPQKWEDKARGLHKIRSKKCVYYIDIGPLLNVK